MLSTLLRSSDLAWWTMPPFWEPGPVSLPCRLLCGLPRSSGRRPWRPLAQGPEDGSSIFVILWISADPGRKFSACRWLRWLRKGLSEFCPGGKWLFKFTLLKYFIYPVTKPYSYKANREVNCTTIIMLFKRILVNTLIIMYSLCRFFAATV